MNEGRGSRSVLGENGCSNSILGEYCEYLAEKSRDRTTLTRRKQVMQQSMRQSMRQSVNWPRKQDCTETR